MTRKNTARSTPRTPVSARKKAVASRRSSELVEAAPSPVATPSPAMVAPCGEPVATSAPSEPASLSTPSEAVAPPTEAIAPDVTPSSEVVRSSPHIPSTMTRVEFEATVRREAWLLAEARSFRNGSPFEDWIRAEAAVRARLDAEGVSIV